MAYFIPVSLTNGEFNPDAWKDVISGDVYAFHHLESGAEYERLDLRQMYQIADAAPAWDCLDDGSYEEMAEEVGFPVEKTSLVKP